MWFIERRRFQWPWTTPNLVFKVTPFFDTEFLTNGYRYGHSYYGRRIGIFILVPKFREAQIEMRRAKRSFEKKLAMNIDSDRKSFYAYVRNRSRVKPSVGPLSNDSDDTLVQGQDMAELLCLRFHSWRHCTCPYGWTTVSWRWERHTHRWGRGNEKAPVASYWQSTRSWQYCTQSFSGT